MNNVILDDIWRQQKEWSATAGEFKAKIYFWRKCVLWLSIGGAIFATLSTQVPEGIAQKIVALTAAALLAVIPVITPKKLSPLKTKDWTIARSVSEGLKEELYLYLAQAEPYTNSGDGNIKILRDRSFEITQKASDLLRHVSSVKSSSGPYPTFNSPQDYLKVRVDKQVDFYQTKSEMHLSKAGKLRNIEFTLAIVAALLAAVTGVFSGELVVNGWSFEFGAWVAVLTTVGGTLTTHLEASRHDHIVTSYSATAYQLRHLKMHWSPNGGDIIPSAEWSAFVHSCEDAISKENESWLVKWAREESL